MPIRIRRARRTDYAALAVLAGWPEVAGGERRTIRLFRSVVADQAYDLYVAEDEGEVIGVGAVSSVRALALGGRRATLEEVVVRADRRRRGVGRSLVEHLAARARRHGVRAFEAAPRDDAGEAFLRAVGFEPLGPRFARGLAG
jgi:N-acetylglutamate synthase-like GNAT family acetyltransferase